MATQNINGKSGSLSFYSNAVGTSFSYIAYASLSTAGYNALHFWIKKGLVKSFACSHCGENKKLDLANISGEYKRTFDDWFWLCRSCHKKYDLSFKRGNKKFSNKKTI